MRSVEPTSNTTASATSNPTSSRHTEVRTVFADPRVARRTRPASPRARRRAGYTPTSTAVIRATMPTKPNTRPLTASSFKRGTNPAPSTRMAPTAPVASKAAMAAPAPTSNTLSTSSWRISRPRDAPSAERITTSRSRAHPRASCALMRFVHAMSSTNVAAPKTTANIVR